MTQTQEQQPIPSIGISMGDPLGIGPEILVKALADPELRKRSRFVIYGLNESMTFAADQLGIAPFWYRVSRGTERSQRELADGVVVVDDPDFHGILMRPHAPSQLGGHASKRFVEDAIADAMLDEKNGRFIDGIVTGPISKTSWSEAGHQWPGHTELFAHRTKAKRSVMAFSSDKLRVALATSHISLMQIRNVLTIGRIFDAIDLGHDACRQLGIKRPRLGVCGLNPHAGEGGLFGDEEQRLIEPAIDVAKRNGIDARGPYSAEVVFRKALEGSLDLVVAMYHDQGLIPMKLLAWQTAVNWTLGLPIIRVSPDHGTAFDIAGKGQANAGSMKAAIKLAIDLVYQRRLVAQTATGS